jgi:hypothetical protein
MIKVFTNIKTIADINKNRVQNKKERLRIRFCDGHAMA